ncbi:Kunitz-type trypsin inhibitor 2 protein [Spatholobus suberectus]|nr:Kunitz-type trypsin inhibitor 2 protein [Spatholobus suberectus]
MKPALLLTLSFLLFAFTTTLPLSFSQGAEKVLDSNGKPVLPAGRYYLKPAKFGPAGSGVKLGQTGNSTCPVTVLQDFSEVVNGLAVKFSVAGTSPGTIFTGTPLDIAFEEKPGCAASSKWVVVADDFPGQWVGIGGAEDHPRKHIITGTFNIQKYNVAYRLLFCPTSATTIPTAPTPPRTCFNVARRDDKSGRRLVLTNGYPFLVMFADAN